MKTKKFGFLGILLALMMMASVLPMAAVTAQPAGAPMMWNAVGFPNAWGIVSPSEVSMIDVPEMDTANDGKTVYAIDSTVAAGMFYASGNGGETWRNLTPAAWPALAITAVSCAPDDPKFVAIAGGTGVAARVFISADGGLNWGTTNIEAAIAGTETIQCLDVAPARSGGPMGTIREIAVGTTNAAATGIVWRFQFAGIAPVWTDTSVLPYTAWYAGDVYAVRFSEAFATDRTLAVVTVDALGINPAGEQDTRLQLGNWGAAPGWNQLTSGFAAAVPIEYPATASITSPGNDTGIAMISASIDMPSDFFGPDPGMRRVYVGYDAAGAGNDDVYRIDHSTCIRLEVRAGANTAIHSVAYSGTYEEGKLLAGTTCNAAAIATGAQVYRTFDPQIRFPTWKGSSKAPTGPATAGDYNASLVWTADGSRAYAGTSTAGAGLVNDESSFSQALDDGVSFNQLSLIDTVVTDMNDIAPSSDGMTLYVTTDNGGASSSVWRTGDFNQSSNDQPLAQRWQRILNIAWARTLIRVSPEDPTGTTFYVFDDGTQNLRYTANAGQTYGVRACNIGVNDLAVRDNTTIFALDTAGAGAGRVAKSADSAWTWAGSVDSRAGNGYMISAVPDSDYVLVGGDDGQASYSSNNAGSFAPVSPAPFVATGAPGGSNVSVVADKNFMTSGNAGENLFYAAADNANRIQRFKIGSSTTWSTIRTQALATVGFFGLQQHCGTLYGIWNGAAADGCERSMYPTVPAQLVNLLWDTMDVGMPAAGAGTFTNPPQALKICDGVTLYAIDVAVAAGADTLYFYNDILSKSGPTLTSPDTGDLVSIDTPSGRAAGVVLTWEEQDLGTRFQVQVAKNSSFTTMIYDNATWSALTNPSLNPLAPSVMLGPTQPGIANVALEAGKEYWWRVRIRDEVTADVVRSQWSEKRSFIVEAGVPISAPYPGPQIMAPFNGLSGVSLTPSFSWSPAVGTECNEYQFVLSTSSDLSSPLVDEAVTTTAYQCTSDLDYEETYFWQVTPTDPVGDASMVANFTTMLTPPEPEAPAPPPATPADRKSVV